MDFKYEIVKRVASLLQMDTQTIVPLLEVPPESRLGDYALPCFQFAKVLRKAPNAIAADLVEKIDKGNVIKSVEAVGGYLNFHLNRSEYIRSILTDISASQGNYGSSAEGSGKTVLVEFSSPNIAKPFHIGHLCSTVIGNSLYKIYKYLGYDTVRINHLGDWGTQFGKLISAYKRWGDGDALNAGPIKELLRIYVKFHEEAEKDPSLEQEARSYFKKLEDNEAEVTALWQKFMDLSLQEFKRVYGMLNIEFDSYAGESFYSDKMDEVVQLLDRKGLLKDSDNAKVVDLEEYNLPPCLILKSDGATIYATRDLAAAIYRNRTYDFHKCVYVVGTPQALHFKQVFHVLKQAGFEWYKDCVHVGFGLVKFADRKLATRSGDVIFLDDVLNEAVAKTLSIIEENSPNLPEKEDVAAKVGIGAVIYTFLKNGRERDIVFSWEDILDFDGESGPYVQYSHARGSSILRKAGEIKQDIDFGCLQAQEEFELVKLLEQFKLAVTEAAEKYEPAVVTRHITSIARAYNKFYNTCSILNADDATKAARVKLTEATCSVLKSGLGLLGMEAPERM